MATLMETILSDDDDKEEAGDDDGAQEGRRRQQKRQRQDLEESDDALSGETGNKSKAKQKKKKKKKKKGKALEDEEPSHQDTNESKGEEEQEEQEQEEEEFLNADFEFGGMLGEDGAVPIRDSSLDFCLSRGKGSSWSYRSVLDILSQNDETLPNGLPKPERTELASIIAAARTNLLQQEGGNENDSDDDDKEKAGANKDKDEEEEDLLKVREGRKTKKKKQNAKDEEEDDDDEDSDDDDDDEEEKADDDDDEQEEEEVRGKQKSAGDDDDDDDDDDDSEAKEEAAKAAAFFDSSSVFPQHDGDKKSELLFSQLNLSRPLLRGVAAMGFVTPTPVQARVIPIALAGRDVCASAVTGSGKTAAFVLPVLERILQRSSRTSKRATKALILTPTRELAAQCLGMMAAMAKLTQLRATLIVGGAKNTASQATELRSRPDVVIATPGRLLDHLTNSAGVDLDDLEFLVLDEADRLLDLGFQDEVFEIVKACPSERQSLLFSATMGTKVDELVKLSLQRPVRVHISAKPKEDKTGVEVAPRLEQEFVRVRSGNEGVNREGMLLALLTRTFTKRVICFFDTKATAHRLMILCGLCGIRCTELHGNLTQTQRLEALEAFRESQVDVLLATDLAARGLDISDVEAVINFEMPTQLETYVHRIGRTARAGRGGKSCTLIGEGRRYLMKQVLKHAEKQEGGEAATTAGVIRSRTIPQAVIAHFVRKIQSLEPHVNEVLDAEAVARMDRIAEIEALRAKNIIEHRDEIMSRPAKQWFATTWEKEAAKEAAAAEKAPCAPGTGEHRMSRKKRRAREGRQLLEPNDDDGDDDADEPSKKKRQVTETTMKLSARAKKREAERREFSDMGRSVHDEDQAMKKKKKKKKKGQGAFAMDAAGDSELFEDERVAFSEKSKEGPRKTSFHFDDFDPNRQLRKGAKKGVNKFKSKSRYKRR